MKSLLFMTAIFLLSCSTPKQVKIQNILGKWKVTTIQNVKLNEDANSFFNFQMEEKLGGNSSCNNYFGSYVINKDKIVISQTGATKKLCFGKLNNYEFLFFQSLSLVDHYKIERNYLTLFSKEGKVLFKANRD